MTVATPQLPSNYDLVDVRALFLSYDGRSMLGTVTFIPSIPHLVSASAKAIILTRPIVGRVSDGVLQNQSGSGPLRLFATDDPDVSITGWTYQVVETLDGKPGRKPYNITVPIAAKDVGIELWELATQAPPVTPGATYVLLPAFATLQDRVAALEANGGGTGTGGGLTTEQAAAAAPVQSVAGRTGDVTLDKGDVGLTAVDNTPDAEKPLSTAVQNALSGKADTADGMTSLERAKLEGVALEATANAPDVELRDRGTHTGLQESASISDFMEAAQDVVAGFVVAGSGVAIGHDDVANTLTFSVAGGAGATVEQVDDAVAAHANSATPHPTYDDMPSLTLLFNNGLV